MLIKELFDSETDYKVVTAKDDEFSTVATIGNRTIEFDAVSVEDAEGEIMWEVVFGERVNTGRITFKQTNSGSELKVFSMVIKSVKELIERYKPDLIIFTADKEGGSSVRGDVYEKLLKRFKIPGYTFTRTAAGLAADLFKLVKN